MLFAKKKRVRKQGRTGFELMSTRTSLVLVCVLFLILGGFLLYDSVRANERGVNIVYVELDPNLGIRPYVEEFFLANEAPEMLSIIECESNFRHFNDDGTLLENRAGSSAVGVAQILASKHPDPKVLRRFNRQFNTDLAPNDFDVTTLAGNLGYALVLYKVRGVRDWECAR